MRALPMSKDQEPSSRPPSRIEQEAIAWFTRMHGEPSAADRRNFERWRKANLAHERAYGDVEATWAAAGQPGARVAAEEAARLDAYLLAMDEAKARHRKGNARITVASALLALVLCAGGWLEFPTALQDFSADHVTARAERRTLTLSDGSTVLLDADSALDESLTETARRVRLLRGAAFFDVEPSTAPFVVEAGPGETRVLGTRFDVAVRDEDVVVTLASGSVTVSSQADAGRAELRPGQSVTYGSRGLGTVRDVSIDDAMAWHGGRFVFDNARLGDVVGQIERYRRGRIVVLGSALADRRISGSFPLDDSDAALASLQSSVGFRMAGIGGRLVVIRP